MRVITDDTDDEITRHEAAEGVAAILNYDGIDQEKGQAQVQLYTEAGVMPERVMWNCDVW